VNKKRDRREAALKAWKTMRGAVWKARRSERLSKRALEEWATDSGFRLLFLDSPRGHPRTGIADAALLRIKPRAADQVELYLFQIERWQLWIQGEGNGPPDQSSRIGQSGPVDRAARW
jgi:hypothetical protein